MSCPKPWLPLSELRPKRYDDHVLVANVAWDSPVTVQAYEVDADRLRNWDCGPTHFLPMEQLPAHRPGRETAREHIFPNAPPKVDWA